MYADHQNNLSFPAGTGRGAGVSSFLARVGRQWLGELADNSVQRRSVVGLLENIQRASDKRLQHIYGRSRVIPSMLAINITTQCNLNCLGCYNREKRDAEVLDHSRIDNTIRQAKELGTHIFIIIGGEPFARQDLMDLLAGHRDVIFLVFTNGTMIDKIVVDRLAGLHHVSLALSIEGFRQDTDRRRGPGVFDAIVASMDRLRERKVFFGFSTTVTRQNYKTVSDSMFIEEMTDLGCRMGWFLGYLSPAHGLKNDSSLNSEEIMKFKQMIESDKVERITITTHFPGEGKHSCRTGDILYIDHDGSVTPCPFAGYKIGNIKERSFKDILAGKPVDIGQSMSMACYGN